MLSGFELYPRGVPLISFLTLLGLSPLRIVSLVPFQYDLNLHGKFSSEMIQLFFASKDEQSKVVVKCCLKLCKAK